MADIGVSDQVEFLSNINPSSSKVSGPQVREIIFQTVYNYQKMCLFRKRSEKGENRKCSATKWIDSSVRRGHMSAITTLDWRFPEK